MGFNKNLLVLRKQKGFSQDELGGKLGVSRQTVSKWELGDTTPELDKIVAISELFGVSIDELVKDKVEVEIEEATQNDMNREEPIVAQEQKKGHKNFYDILYLGLKIIGLIVIVDMIIMSLYFIVNGFPT